MQGICLIVVYYLVQQFYFLFDEKTEGLFLESSVIFSVLFCRMLFAILYI